MNDLEQLHSFRIEKVESQLKEISMKIDTLLESLPDRFCSKELCMEKMKNMQEEINKLQATQDRATWALLTGLASFVWTAFKSLFS